MQKVLSRVQATAIRHGGNALVPYKKKSGEHYQLLGSK